MAVKSTAAKPAEKKTPAKKPAAKPVGEKQQAPEKNPVEKKQAKGRPVQAPAKAASVKKAKPLRFAQLWSERHPDRKSYVARFGDMDTARLYIDYAEGFAPNNIQHITKAMLAMMVPGSAQDVERAYRRALISYNISQLSPEKLAVLNSLYSAQSIKNWRDEVATPSDETLEHLEDRGIYLCEGSVLEIDEFQQPPKKKVARNYSPGDEVYDLFTGRDLNRVEHLTDDYERNVQHVDFHDYESLTQLKAFRAMLELWPTSFRHYANKAADIRDLSWTFITSVFRAVVRKDRVEVIVGEDKQGYSFFATTASLQDAVERVFHYFDTLSGDQLEVVLQGVGFEYKAVAGMGFEVIQDIQQNPSAFMSSLPGKAIRMTDTGMQFTAAEFLLLAAEAPRGVYFERDSGMVVDDLSEYRMTVNDMRFRVFYLDSGVYESGEHRGAASLREHQRILETGRAILNIHGIYVDEHNVMQLPISAEAESNFHPEKGIGPDDESFFMHSVTFI